MGKKRKAGGRPFGHDEPRREPKGDSKLRINTYEDVADSEDEFHINQDKILLEEGPAQKRQRKAQEEEAFLEPSDEEVLVANDDVSDSEEEYEDAEETPEPSKRRAKLAKPGKRPQDSDSEASAAPEEDEDVGDYYNADKIETEADALEEEAEARRLQQKQLQGMTEADFGFDEIDWKEAGKDIDDDDEGQGKIISLPKVEITDVMGPEERLKILRTRYPEFEPLSREFLELQTVHEDLRTAAIEAETVQQHKFTMANSSGDSQDLLIPIAVLKLNALRAYLASLSMYFALFTSGQAGSDGQLAAISPEQLRDHAIMETLVTCRDLWETVKTVEVPETVDSVDAKSQFRNGRSDNLVLSNGAVDEDQERPKKRKHRKSKAQKAADAAQAEADERRAQRLRKTEEELASLTALTNTAKKLPKPSKTSTKPINAQEDSESDFGEQTNLTAHEAAEKAKRKKSLRFYTSQIAQKSNKRDAAGRDAGGDADIPYRERLKDRQARLNAEAEQRGKEPKESSKGDPLGGPSDEEDHTAAQELRNGEGSGSEDYYDLVASRSAGKKAAKAVVAAAHTQAEKEGGIVRVVEDEGVDGKRAISYAIEKNKGLAPKRKKDVRNPRVKKRKKYEDKKKKLGSIRQIYKGGEPRGGYSGEKTGIKKDLIRSVKL
ncbi:hypothetical protein OEA41_005291 [Lepraria neglecta]|uniref:Sas10 C-terminal domain-containing protein n=1 Tax=Lepraria neglecta TaxID=209136 RepID=A0AAD9Z1I8_9LECA|nr:hypothetical protein OEA41_005291 [Lepraria neglecta]